MLVWKFGCADFLFVSWTSWILTDFSKLIAGEDIPPDTILGQCGHCFIDLWHM